MPVLAGCLPGPGHERRKRTRWQHPEGAEPPAAQQQTLPTSTCSYPPAEVRPVGPCDPRWYLCPSGSGTASSTSTQGAATDSQTGAGLSAKAGVGQGS